GRSDRPSIIVIFCNSGYLLLCQFSSTSVKIVARILRRSCTARKRPRVRDAPAPGWNNSFLASRWAQRRLQPSHLEQARAEAVAILVDRALARWTISSPFIGSQESHISRRGKLADPWAALPPDPA